jgi:hypothetical protein
MKAVQLIFRYFSSFLIVIGLNNILLLLIRIIEYFIKNPINHEYSLGMFLSDLTKELIILNALLILLFFIYRKFAGIHLNRTRLMAIIVSIVFYIALAAFVWRESKDLAPIVADSQPNELLKPKKNKQPVLHEIPTDNQEYISTPESLIYYKKVLLDTIFPEQKIRTEYKKIIAKTAIDNKAHYIDIMLGNIEGQPDEVFMVYELSDEEESILHWNKYVMSAGNENLTIHINTEECDGQQLYLRLFLWNESVIPYGFRKLQVTLYQMEE